MSQYSEIYELNGISRIVRDKIVRDGSMEFLVSWREYGPFWNSWKAVSFFEDKATTLSEWLQQTQTPIPVAEDIEMVVSKPHDGGYVVKRVERPKDVFEWLPEEMIPRELVEELHARENNLMDIEGDVATDETTASESPVATPADPSAAPPDATSTTAIVSQDDDSITPALPQQEDGSVEEMERT